MEWTPLHIAASHGESYVLSDLLKEKPNVNVTYMQVCVYLSVCNVCVTVCL